MSQPLRGAPHRLIPLVARSRRACDFFISGAVCGRKAPKSILPTGIAGVLRLRATKPSVCDRSAMRFAQDDGFVWGLAMQLVGYAGARKDLKCRSLSAERLTG